MNYRFIVAEICKNWKAGDSDTPSLLSQKFEAAININFTRGYRLIDWKTHGFSHADTATETIIAIFEKINPELSKPVKP